MTTRTEKPNQLIAETLADDKLPSLPAVALEIVRLCKTDDVPLDELARVVSIDPSLTAKILKLANSPKFNRGQELTDIERACFVLGLKTLKIMALGFSVAESTRTENNENAFDYDAFWVHSISCAVAARDLARCLGSAGDSDAFVCGLFGRIGQLAMARAIPTEYEAVTRKCTTILPESGEEQDVLGFDHHLISDRLLRKWDIPELLTCGVRYWETPEQAGEAEPLCRIVRLADQISKILHEREKGTHLAKAYEIAETDFDMSQSELDGITILLHEEINSLANILDVKIKDQQQYQTLIDEAREQMVQVSIQAAMELETTSLDLQYQREKAMELASKSRELLRKSQMDALTEIPNRGAFDEKLKKNVALRIAEPGLNGFGVLMIDVDHFKEFNDRYGHHVGDRVLKRVTSVIRNSLRPTDFVARYGGEEFVVLLSDNSLEELKTIGERVRSAVEGSVFECDGNSLGVTISIGGAYGNSFNEISDGAELVKLADRCLYESKNRGRNQCSYASLPSTERTTT